MRTVVIIQARMGSTRLPGKVLMPLAGKPMLEHVIRRTQAAKGVDEVCIATTTHDRDTPLVEMAERFGASTFRGSEDDVLSRYAGAARATSAELVVRVTSDCPLYDPQLLGEMLASYHEMGGAEAMDYYSNTVKRTYPRGLDTEIFPAAVLFRVEAVATAPPAREHVTWHIYNHPSDFRIGQHQQSASANDSSLRWTVDTPEDYEFASQVYSNLYSMIPEFGFRDILSLVQRCPELSAINAHIEQKKL
ncbi:NTP transferase domain-containing protein [bacterium]|nr:NTP transferase domain-containing protein [bacterium]